MLQLQVQRWPTSDTTSRPGLRHKKINGIKTRQGRTTLSIQVYAQNGASNSSNLSKDNGSIDKISVDDIDSYSPENGPFTPLLNSINYPVHIKNFNISQLTQLCRELRQDVVHKVSRTGGHLGSSLGVVELTVALHYVYDAPADKIIWDVGHQAYIHKMLTGRRKFMPSIRQTGGLSGFVNRSESEYDPFGTGHSSTSISAALGMAAGRDLRGKKNQVVAVIGDGAITGGMAYEAMNHAGYLDKNMVVILNDNQQVSLPTQYNGKNQRPVGALSSALSRIQSNQNLRELREGVKDFTKRLPIALQEFTSKVDEYGRGIISGKPSTLFEELGFYYIGPVDGHSLDDLIYILQEVRRTNTEGPVLIHVITEKGKGYLPASSAEDRMHGVVKYDYFSGKQNKSTPKTGSYTNFFADALIAEAEADSKVVAVHAAMAGGTGLQRFEKRFPDKVWDVGIAEQHAVTFSAGLACEGFKPMCTIYSTFLQRGYDQIVHDVCLQNLPVRFAMDRAGMVGADGGTHMGSFDIAYMGCLPNMILMAPSNEAELINMVATSIAIDDGPSCLRYPRGNGIGLDLEAQGVGPKLKGKVLQVGKGIVRRGGKDVCFLGYGTMVNNCMKASEIMSEYGISATVVDARFCKPLDTQLIRHLCKEHQAIITVEEGSRGGFGAYVMHYLSDVGLFDNGLKFRAMTLPDRFIDHGSQDDQIIQAGLDPMNIARTASKIIGANMDLHLTA